MPEALAAAGQPTSLQLRPPRAAAPPAVPAATALQPPSEGAAEQRNGSTMAAQLARANSAPVKPVVSRAAAGRKAAQATGAGRGRGTKTLVPPPPPLSSTAKEEGSQVQLSAASARDAKAAAGMQLKRSPSQKAAASAQLAAAAAAAAQPVAVASTEGRTEPQSPAHKSAGASPRHAAPGHAANGTYALPHASVAPQVAPVRQRSAGPPPRFAAGPPPGFERPLVGAFAPVTTASQAGGLQQQLRGSSDREQSAQLPLRSANGPTHPASNGLTGPVPAETRNGSGRTQSRFSFARSPPVGGGVQRLPQLMMRWLQNDSCEDSYGDAN